MAYARLKWILSTERRRKALIIILWGLGISFTFLQGLLQRTYLTPYDYGLALAVCLLAGAVIVDVGKAVLSYLAAMALAIPIIILILILPALLGELPSPGDVAISNFWIVIVFTAIFPFPIIGFLLATFIGAFIGEQYF